MKVLISIDKKIHIEEVCCPSCKKVHYLKIQEGIYKFITEKEAQQLKLGFLKQMGGNLLAYIIMIITFILLFIWVL